MQGRGRGIINPKNLGFGVPLAIIGGKFKASSTQLADLNGDCTIALLKRFSSAQLFALVSLPEFSNRHLRKCAMVALKDAYAPFSLKSSFNADGTYAVYIADAKNCKMAVLKHPDLFHRSPLSDFLDKADILLTADFDPANLHVWLDVARSTAVSQLHLAFACVQWYTPTRGPSVTELVQAFSSVRSLCISVDSSFERRFGSEDCYHRELEDALEAVSICMLGEQLHSLQLVLQPVECVPAALCLYGRPAFELTQHLPRSPSLECIDLRGVLIKPCRHYTHRLFWWEGPYGCELLFCRMLAELKANRGLKCIKLRCHVEFISKLQDKLPEGCKIVELNGEPVLNEEILASMHCSPDKVVIVQEKQAMNEEDQVEKLYLHIDCVPPPAVP